MKRFPFPSFSSLIEDTTRAVVERVKARIEAEVAQALEPSQPAASPAPRPARKRQRSQPGTSPAKKGGSSRKDPRLAKALCGACGQKGHHANYSACPSRPAREHRTPAAARKPAPTADEDEPAAAAADFRRCFPFPRARTFDFPARKRPRKGWDVDLERLRPRTRGDCIDGPRPCPFLSCKFHLAISVHEETGRVKETFPHLKILADPAGPGLLQMAAQFGSTCALDIADQNDDGSGTSGLGGLLLLRKLAMSGESLGNHPPGLDITEAGRRLNLSIERTRQLSSKAMQEVRVKLARLGEAFTRPGRRPAEPKRAREPDFGELVRSSLGEHFGEKERALGVAWRDQRYKGSAPHAPSEPSATVEQPAEPSPTSEESTDLPPPAKAAVQ